MSGVYFNGSFVTYNGCNNDDDDNDDDDDDDDDDGDGDVLDSVVMTIIGGDGRLIKIQW